MTALTAVQTIDGEEIEYLLHQGGGRLAVLFHGGHLRADLEIGHETFLAAGCSVLHPSRPGYGGTPLSAGPDSARFADRIATLCEQLGYREVVAVGVSAGGRTATTFAVRHPYLVTGLVLESATSFLPWPAPSTSVVAKFAFRSGVERVTWAMTRFLFRRFPAFTFRRMLSSLSTMRPGVAYERLNAAERETLIDLLARMRSGRGFINDLRTTEDVTRDVTQPTLVVASRNDGAVPLRHAYTLVDSIPNADLVVTDAVSHFLWIGPHAEEERHAVMSFLEHLPLMERD